MRLLCRWRAGRIRVSGRHRWRVVCIGANPLNLDCLERDPEATEDLQEDINAPRGWAIMTARVADLSQLSSDDCHISRSEDRCACKD